VAAVAATINPGLGRAGSEPRPPDLQPGARRGWGRPRSTGRLTGAPGPLLPATACSGGGSLLDVAAPTPYQGIHGVRSWRNW